jgi:uncharacterized membrane protein
MNITLLHPIVNHFTIALFVLVVFLDILGWISKKEYFHTAAWINLIFGAISGVLSLVTGILAEANVPHREAAHEIMETHEILGFLIVGAILILFVWRLILKGQFPAKAMVLYLLIGLAGAGVMIRSAFLGGELVFVHGVSRWRLFRLVPKRLSITMAMNPACSKMPHIMKKVPKILFMYTTSDYTICLNTLI